MANVIFINPSPKISVGINSATVSPPLGLAYMASALEKDGHTVRIIDAHIGGISPADIIESFPVKPDLIGVSSNIITYNNAVEYARRCHAEHPEIPIVFGGPHPSSVSSKVLADNPFVDSVVIGEGERTIIDICRGLGSVNMYKNIKGVAYRQDGKIVLNDPQPLVENLDDIPRPAYHLLPDLRKYSTRSRIAPAGFILSSRGCSYPCTFCNKNIFGRSWRPHSAQRVIEDIRYLVNDRGVRQIVVLDDNFTFDKKRTVQILEALINEPYKLCINLQNGIRIDQTDEELLKLMKRAGVFKVGFGIETFNKDVQKNIKKIVDLDKAVRLTKAARSLDIVTVGFFILGLPGDNEETMEETIQFMFRMNPHIVNLAICIPFPGTELYLEVKKSGILYEDVDCGIDSGFFGNTVYFSMRSVDKEKILHFFNKAYKKFYMRPSKVLDILSTVKSFDEFRWITRAVSDMLF